MERYRHPFIHYLLSWPETILDHLEPTRDIVFYLTWRSLPFGRIASQRPYLSMQMGPLLLTWLPQPTGLQTDAPRQESNGLEREGGSVGSPEAGSEGGSAGSPEAGSSMANPVMIKGPGQCGITTTVVPLTHTVAQKPPSPRPNNGSRSEGNISFIGMPFWWRRVQGEPWSWELQINLTQGLRRIFRINREAETAAVTSDTLRTDREAGISAAVHGPLQVNREAEIGAVTSDTLQANREAETVSTTPDTLQDSTEIEIHSATSDTLKDNREAEIDPATPDTLHDSTEIEIHSATPNTLKASTEEIDSATPDTPIASTTETDSATPNTLKANAEEIGSATPDTPNANTEETDSTLQTGPESVDRRALDKSDVQVMVRLRGRTEYEGDEELTDMSVTDGQTLTIHARHSADGWQWPEPGTHKFDHVFGPSCHPREILEKIEPMIQAFVTGHDLCIVTDGPSTSDKSAIMFDHTDCIIDRSMMEIFSRVRDFEAQGWKCEVGCAAYEVYARQLYNLVSEYDPRSSGERRTRLLIDETDTTKGCYSVVPGPSAEAVIGLIRGARQNRSFRSMYNHPATPRGHFIFTVTLTRSHMDRSEPVKSQLFLVDLADTEDLASDWGDATHTAESNAVGWDRAVIHGLLRDWQCDQAFSCQGRVCKTWPPPHVTDADLDHL